jgi:hypothetical protein
VTLFSAKEDFCRTTLAGLPGVLAKLDYVSNLRDADGRYQHWGLARIYGDEAAQRTIAEVHRLLFLDILRMPMRKLLLDAASAGSAEKRSLQDFVEELGNRAAGLVPPELGGGSVRHFNSMISALLAVAKSSPAATPAGA